MRKRKKKSPVVRKDTSQKARKKAVIKKRVSTKPKTGEYLGIPYDSQGEFYFLKWTEELIASGHIKSIRRADSYILTEGLINNYTIPLRKGLSSKTISQTLLRPSLYTAEFEIIWDSKKYKDFVWLLGTNTKFDKPLIGHKSLSGDIYTIIECKPDFDKGNLTRLFVNNQKFVWSKYQIFVNLVKPTEFFSSTFTPDSYLKTFTGKVRILKYKPITLQQYLTIN